ncbi:MAG TPA: hypothetical protein VJ553_07045 [Candidatus Paceibacterota bacterium]|nr:hypothetical protein [Candidatus Paceibacterota bacterium]
MERIAGEEAIFSADFTKDCGRDVLTDIGRVDVLIRIMRSPSTLRLILVAVHGYRKIRIEEIVLGHDLKDLLCLISLFRLQRVLGQAFDCKPEQFGTFFRVRVAPLLEPLRWKMEQPAEPQTVSVPR